MKCLKNFRTVIWLLFKKVKVGIRFSERNFIISAFCIINVSSDIPNEVNSLSENNRDYFHLDFNEDC